jgi:hypothetical protein
MVAVVQFTACLAKAKNNAPVVNAFSDVHEDHHTLVSAICNVLPMPATISYHLNDNSTSHDDDSNDVLLAATDLILGDHFTDDAFNITKDNNEDDSASDATNNVDDSDNRLLANSEKVSYESNHKPFYTASLDGVPFDYAYHSSADDVLLAATESYEFKDESTSNDKSAAATASPLATVLYTTIPTSHHCLPNTVYHLFPANEYEFMITHEGTSTSTADDLSLYPSPRFHHLTFILKSKPPLLLAPDSFLVKCDKLIWILGLNQIPWLHCLVSHDKLSRLLAFTCTDCLPFQPPCMVLDCISHFVPVGMIQVLSHYVLILSHKTEISLPGSICLTILLNVTKISL